MGQKVTRVDQHQSLSRERPLGPVQSSPVRSISEWSSKPLLVISACQQVVTERSQAFSSRRLAFRQEFASELLHLSLLSSQSSILLFRTSPCFWRKSLAVLSVVSSQSRPPRLGVEPGTLGVGVLPLCDRVIHSGNSRVVSEAVEPSSRAQWGTRVLCHGLGSVVQKFSVASFLLCRTRR